MTHHYLLGWRAPEVDDTVVLGVWSTEQEAWDERERLVGEGYDPAELIVQGWDGTDSEELTHD